MEEIKEDDNPFGTPVEITHHSECWKYHGVCAINRLTQIETLLSMAKKKIDKEEILKIIQG